MDNDFGLVTGAAGCGKTYAVRKKIEENPGWGLLTATTGVAARNLGGNVPTVHSALGFFDIASLRRLSENGDLAKAMQKRILDHDHARLVIDESSMLTREALDILHSSAEEVGLGIWLVGDFLQLPPIVRNNETSQPWWAFQASCWPAFANNTHWLNRNHRQSNPEFLSGLNHLRAGRGGAAISNFRHCGVHFTKSNGLDYRFPGTTIVATNPVREQFNARMYNALIEEETTYRNDKWGKQRTEWREIPATVSLKIGTRVMVLINKYDNDRNLLYANGDTGTVTYLGEDCVCVEREDGERLDIGFAEVDDSEILGHEYQTNENGEEVRVAVKSPPTGGVKYMPLTQAWAITVHKSQGLTLDAVQVNLPENFYGSPAMVYTACSRCKAPENLVLVGGDRWLAERCRVDRHVRGWIEPPRAA